MMPNTSQLSPICDLFFETCSCFVIFFRSVVYPLVFCGIVATMILLQRCLNMVSLAMVRVFNCKISKIFDFDNYIYVLLTGGERSFYHKETFQSRSVYPHIVGVF